MTINVVNYWRWVDNTLSFTPFGLGLCQTPFRRWWFTIIVLNIAIEIGRD